MNPEQILNRPLRAALLWTTVVVAATYVYIFEPGKSGFFPGCPFRALTGFTCPGCGATRGLHCLLHGDPVAAFQLNPLLMLALPFLLYELLRYTYSAARDRPFNWNRINTNYAWVLVGAILSFWIFRNTSFYPFPS